MKLWLWVLLSKGGVITGDVKDVVLLDVTPLSLGIETMGGSSAKLDRNATIPTSKSQSLLNCSRQPTSCWPSTFFKVNAQWRQITKTLGRFKVADIPAAPRESHKSKVTFDIDKNGIVSVKAKDRTQKEQTIVINLTQVWADEEIDHIIERCRSKRFQTDKSNKSRPS